MNGGVLYANLAATIFLTGIAWFQQTVSLPLFLKIAKPELANYARLHRRRNTLLMSGPMAVEAVTAVWLWREAPVALALLAIIWIVTFAWYIPLYSRLICASDDHLIRRLIHLNWLRTLCWTARAALMLWIASA